MSYLFGKLCDQGISWHWKNDVRSWFKAARNFVFTPDSNRTLIWHCLIYLSSLKVIDIINQCEDQRQKCYILKSYVITWIGCLHLICGKDLRSKKYPIMTDRHRKNQHCSNLHDVWTYVIQSNTYSMYHIIDYWYIINILLILDYQYIIGMMIWETCLTGNQAVLPLSPSDQNLKQMSLLSGFYEPYF